MSKRVKEIAIHMGINRDKCHVLHIGTKFADNQMTNVKYPVKNGILKILYMRYMRKDNGFYFFLDALQKMPDKLARRIEVVVAARFDDMNVIEKLKKLNDKFYSVNLFNGYTYKEIPVITKGVNLGIVPVIWEDNLLQVAMEMKAMGIPVLASDRGGANELSSNAALKFKAENMKDFIIRLEYIKNMEMINIILKMKNCEILNNIV